MKKNTNHGHENIGQAIVMFAVGHHDITNTKHTASVVKSEYVTFRLQTSVALQSN